MQFPQVYSLITACIVCLGNWNGYCQMALSIYRRISNDIYTQFAKMDLAEPSPYTVEVYV